VGDPKCTSLFFASKFESRLVSRRAADDSSETRGTVKFGAGGIHPGRKKANLLLKGALRVADITKGKKY